MLQKTMLALLAFAGILMIMTQGVVAIPLDASAMLEHKDSLGIRTQAMAGQDAPVAAPTLQARDNPKPKEWQTWNSSDHSLIPVYAHDISKNYRNNLALAPHANVRLFKKQLHKLNDTFKASKAPFRFIYTGVFSKYRPSYDYGGKPCPSVDSPEETAVRHNRHIGKCDALNWYLVDRLTIRDTPDGPCKDISSHANDPSKCHLSKDNMQQDGITITRHAMETSADGTEFITAAAKWLGLDFDNKLAIPHCKDGDLLDPHSKFAKPLHPDCPQPVNCTDPVTGESKIDPQDSYTDNIPDRCKRRFRRTEVDQMAANFVTLREGVHQQ